MAQYCTADGGLWSAAADDLRNRVISIRSGLCRSGLCLLVFQKTRIDRSAKLVDFLIDEFPLIRVGVK
jgi:hypothetical protein